MTPSPGPAGGEFFFGSSPGCGARCPTQRESVASAGPPFCRLKASAPDGAAVLPHQSPGSAGPPPFRRLKAPASDGAAAPWGQGPPFGTTSCLYSGPWHVPVPLGPCPPGTTAPANVQTMASITKWTPTFAEDAVLSPWGSSGTWRCRAREMRHGRRSERRPPWRQNGGPHRSRCFYLPEPML